MIIGCIGDDYITSDSSNTIVIGDNGYVSYYSLDNPIAWSIPAQLGTTFEGTDGDDTISVTINPAGSTITALFVAGCGGDDTITTDGGRLSVVAGDNLLVSMTGYALDSVNRLGTVRDTPTGAWPLPIDHVADFIRISTPSNARTVVLGGQGDDDISVDTNGVNGDVTICGDTCVADWTVAAINGLVVQDQDALDPNTTYDGSDIITVRASLSAVFAIGCDGNDIMNVANSTWSILIGDSGMVKVGRDSRGYLTKLVSSTCTNNNEIGGDDQLISLLSSTLLDLITTNGSMNVFGGSIEGIVRSILLGGPGNDRITSNCDTSILCGDQCTITPRTSVLSNPASMFDGDDQLQFSGNHRVSVFHYFHSHSSLCSLHVKYGI
jgi:hypothetical protein